MSGFAIISGVPALGLPKMYSVFGANSRSTLAAPAAWSMVLKSVRPRLSMAARRRAFVVAKSALLTTCEEEDAACSAVAGALSVSACEQAVTGMSAKTLANRTVFIISCLLRHCLGTLK